jgi:hypothetical protein
MAVDEMSDWNRSDVSDSIEKEMPDCGWAVNDDDPLGGN